MSFDVVNSSAEKITIERVEVEVTIKNPSVVVVLPPDFVTAMDDDTGRLGSLCGWDDYELEPRSSTVSDTIRSAARHDPEFERASVFAAYATTNETNATNATRILVGLVFGIAYETHAEVSLLCAKRREGVRVGSALLDAFERDAGKTCVTVAPIRNATGFYERRGYVRGLHPDADTLVKTMTN